MDQSFSLKFFQSQPQLNEKGFKTSDKMKKFLESQQQAEDSTFAGLSPQGSSFKKIVNNQKLLGTPLQPQRYYGSKSCSGLDKLFKKEQSIGFPSRYPEPPVPSPPKQTSKPLFLNISQGNTGGNAHLRHTAGETSDSKSPMNTSNKMKLYEKGKFESTKSMNRLNVQYIPKIDLSCKTSESSNQSRSAFKQLSEIASSNNSSHKSVKVSKPKNSFLNFPAAERTQTRSVPKPNNNVKKNAKIPAFIKTKHEYDKPFKKNGSEANINIKFYPAIRATMENQQDMGCNFEIQINIKPAVKKRSIEDFMLVKSLGKGTFGTSYVAVDKATRYICALKILPKQKIREYESQTSLFRQIKIQSFLSHRHITTLYGVFDDQQNVYLIMELLSEGNLKDRIKKKVFTEKTAAYFTYQICCASFLHDKSIMHRDIKPENIFLNQNYVKIGDFGCAVYTDANRRSFIGSPCYLSPQQLIQDEYSQKIDMWQIGNILYEMIYRGCPFEKDIIEITQGVRNVSALSELYFPIHTVISNECKDFLTRCLDKNSQTRLSSQQSLRHNFFCQILEDPQLAKYLL